VAFTAVAAYILDHLRKESGVKGPIAAAVAAAALVLAGGAVAVNPIEGVTLKAVAKSGVTGKADAGARGLGTFVRFRVRGLAPNARVRAFMQAGNCKKHGASFATAGSATADANGVATWSASVLFRTEDVPWDVVADGAHIFRIVGGGRTVACGVVPGMS
jgi:hypothetical protein